MNDREHAPLHGIWQVMRAELGGQPMPADASSHVELEFSTTGYTVRFGHETTDAGVYEVADHAPYPRITLTGRHGVNAGRSLPGILQLKSNLLQLCFALEGHSAPTEFSAPAGTSHYLAIYRRKS